MNPPFPLADLFSEPLRPTGPAEPVGGGFSGAGVMRVPTAARPVAVRTWPDAADPVRLRGLHRLLGHVAGRGVPVAVPFASRAGETLVRYAGRWHQVEPWLPGRADFRESPTDAKLAAAVVALADFHAAAATFRPHRDEREWFGEPRSDVAPVVRERLAFLAALQESEADTLRAAVRSDAGEFAALARRTLDAFDRTAAGVAARLVPFAARPVPLVICLRDVWHDHVLFAGDRVTGLIDPSAARLDSPATDLARLLGSLVGGDRTRWRFALAAYAARRPLIAAEIDLAAALDAAGVLLSGMNWLRRRYLLGRPCDSPAVLARLGEIVGRLEGGPPE